MSNDEIILYTTEDGLAKIQLTARDGSVWLNQHDIANLFQKARSTIAEHIQHIFDEQELDPNSVCRNFRRTATDKKTYEIQYYNLDLVLSVGYRVRSVRGVQFRQWATTTLREFLVKGFVMDDARLKEPESLSYFEELLERIREIRASEKRFYQKIKEAYALSADYQPQADTTKLFFKTVQNKMLWAVTGKTAAELLVERADATLPNMGLSSWKGSRVRKGDVTISKNYLSMEEISELNRITTMFLDFAEDQTKKRKAIYMKDWEERLDSFLAFYERPILDHAGSISHEEAEAHVYECYETFNLNRQEQELIESENEAFLDLQAIERELKNQKK